MLSPANQPDDLEFRHTRIVIMRLHFSALDCRNDAAKRICGLGGTESMLVAGYHPSAKATLRFPHAPFPETCRSPSVGPIASLPSAKPEDL